MTACLPPSFRSSQITRPPILFFAFNRPEHTRRALTALAECSGAAESRLVVFVDGPRSEAETGLCAQVATCAREAVGFRSVSVCCSATNKGLYASITEGVGKTLVESASVIVVEDDLLVAKSFLDYMAWAIEHYQDEASVGCVHGYALPISGLPDFYFLRGGDCWGWATWRDRWSLFRGDAVGLLAEISEKELLRKFMLTHGAASLDLLSDRVLGKNESWAILWHASLFLSDRLTLHPGQTLVTNIGNDGSGTHSAASDRFSSSDHLGRLPDPHLIPVAHDERVAALTSAFMDGLDGRRYLAGLLTWLMRSRATRVAKQVLRSSTTRRESLRGAGG